MDWNCGVNNGLYWWCWR